MGHHILVIEDDAEISDLVALHLRRAGHRVDVARDGEEGLTHVRSGRFDLVVLDLMLPPGPDGLDVCREIRARSAYTPVLMLTARADEVDRILGLEIGADDYVTKPFRVRELVARVKATLRRMEALRAPEGTPGARPIEVDGLHVDPATRAVRVDGRAVELTPKEFELLCHFARHPGRVFTRSALLERIWGYGHEGYGHTVNSHINRLRRKIERDPAEPHYILTVWGVGYKFRDPRAGAGG